MIRYLGYKKLLVCVEPQKKISQLLKQKTRGYLNTVVLTNLAIFNRNFKKKFYIYENTQTSSIKKSLKKKYNESYSANYITLDNLLSKNLFKKKKIDLLKDRYSRYWDWNIKKI